MPGNPTSFVLFHLHASSYLAFSKDSCVCLFVWLVLFLLTKLVHFGHGPDGLHILQMQKSLLRVLGHDMGHGGHLHLREVEMMQLDPLWQRGGRFRAGCVFL